MTHRNNLYSFAILLNGVQNPIVADPKSIF